MDSAKIKFVFLGIVAAFAAIYLGVSSASAQFETVAWVVGSLTVISCLMMGRSIWLLIPFLAAVNLNLRLPTTPSSLLVAQVLVIGFSFLFFAARRISLRPTLTELEWWMIGLTLMIGQVYIRNPAGVSFAGSDTVGGKAYITYGLTLVSAFYLSWLVIDQKDLKRIFPLVVLGSFINLGIGVLGKFIPIVGYFAGAKFEMADTATGAKDSAAATRFLELAVFGQKLSLFVASLKNPLRAALNPFWLLAIAISLAAVLYGGFRSGVMAVMLTYVVGTWYRGGFVSVLVGSVLGFVAIGVLAVVNSVSPLPPNIQRSLTFLPGTWEQRYIDDAEGSTEWRVEIWIEVLTTDRWIKNKFFGDGLGFSKANLEYVKSLSKMQGTGISGFDMHRETILANGDYHSGPVSTIRVIGYVGLLFLLIFQIRLMVLTHRQILRCRGTEWYPLALLIGIPIMWQPVFFHVFFGDFRSEAAGILISCGMIRILQRWLPLPEYSKYRAPVSVPLATQPRALAQR
ncbi:MAG: hypothetical protein CAK88_11480 [Verrucomicrobiia bacterium AMD-G2]|nr:MAG: hypothetical protein CAK88_11480 [Verrucomicrobiae bacterium AMD-G2]